MLMALVKYILEAARKRLAVLSREASLIDAARILADRDTPLIVVCDGDGIAVGVISSSHVVNVLAPRGG
jgi:CBS domain-containing protein